MLRTAAAVTAGKAARVAARLRGSGGSAMPGLVAERVAPRILSTSLARVDKVVVVSGTNGKTTTTRMLVAILRAHGRDVFTNPTGSNFTRGVLSEMLPRLPLSGRLKADLAVLELDEAHAMRFIDEVAPTHSLLLNVARDQLDRFAEIDHTAKLLERIGAATTEGVVLNADDPFVSRTAAAIGAERFWFALDSSIRDRLSELTEHYGGEDDVPRVELGEEDARLRPIDERDFEILFGDLVVGPLALRQRGLAAMINATAAATTARMLLGADFDQAVAADALRTLTPPFGRGEIIDAGGTPVELVLVKNPAGFTVALGTYGSSPTRTMIAINDNDADGRDVSWLYDVSFASLAEQGVAMVSGVRAYDMALRLGYDGVESASIEPDLGDALEQFLAADPGEPRRIFCTYTSMMALRSRLAQRYDVPDFGTEGQG